MKKKHIAIEILPRVIWVLMAIVLFVGHKIIGRGPIHDGKDNIIGLIFLIIGIGFVIWTFFYLGKVMVSKKLIMVGPYKYIRHPMYIAIYTLLFGIGILWFSWLWFIVMVIFIPLFFISCKLEEGQMTDLHGEDYKKYKREVGMFFPKFK